MKILKGKFIREEIKCESCNGSGHVPEKIACPNYGEAIAGGHCKYCGAAAGCPHEELQTGETSPCVTCKGKGRHLESLQSLVPRKLVRFLPFKIYRQYEHLEIMGSITDRYDSSCRLEHRDYLVKPPSRTKKAVMAEVWKWAAITVDDVCRQDGKSLLHFGILLDKKGWHCIPIYRGTQLPSIKSVARARPPKPEVTPENPRGFPFTIEAPRHLSFEGECLPPAVKRTLDEIVCYCENGDRSEKRGDTKAAVKWFRKAALESDGSNFLMFGYDYLKKSAASHLAKRNFEDAHLYYAALLDVCKKRLPRKGADNLIFWNSIMSAFSLGMHHWSIGDYHLARTDFLNAWKLLPAESDVPDLHYFIEMMALDEGVLRISECADFSAARLHCRVLLQKMSSLIESAKHRSCESVRKYVPLFEAKKNYVQAVHDALSGAAVESAGLSRCVSVIDKFGFREHVARAKSFREAEALLKAFNSKWGNARNIPPEARKLLLNALGSMGGAFCGAVSNHGLSSADIERLVIPYINANTQRLDALAARLQANSTQMQQKIADVKSEIRRGSEKIQSRISGRLKGTGTQSIRVGGKTYCLEHLYAIPDPHKRLARLGFTKAMRDFSKVIWLEWTNSAIANKFEIDLGTVPSEKNRIFDRLGVKRSAPAAAGLLALILKGVEKKFLSSPFQRYPENRKSKELYGDLPE